MGEQITAYVLLFDLVTGGELLDYVRDPLKPFSEKTALFLFIQLIKAVKYIHSRGVYHLDIKLENILVDGPLDLDNSDNWLKLADFGLSKSIDQGDDGTFSTG